ncbi:MAG: IS110 family transposase [bacterium]|nr:IS110 family transposase [bacterium]
MRHAPFSCAGTIQREQLLFVGMDVHKDTHAAVGTTAYGEKLFEVAIGNNQKDFNTLIRQSRSVADERGLGLVFGLEDSSGYGERLAKHLFLNNILVKTVSPIFVDRERKYETHPEKNDSLDAFAAAKVLIQKIDTLPTYRITKQNEIAKEIKELSLDREFLIKEQTRIKNQLHRLLHKAYNSEYRKRFKDPFGLKSLKYWSAHPLPTTKAKDDIIGTPEILKNQIKRKVKRLIDIREEVNEVKIELQSLIEQTGQQITTLNGCGVALGSKVLAEIKDIDRFHSPSALAKYAGLAPREKSSGKTFRHIKTKSGNRQLNTALHRIALSQISRSGNQFAKEYFQRKISEGKTKAQALCCLKRRLVDIIYMMLKHRQPYKQDLHSISPTADFIHRKI